MDDTKIIELFWARKEDAIAETDAAYGKNSAHWQTGFWVAGKTQKKA